MTIGAVATLIAAALSVLGVFLRLVVYRRARADARREFELERAQQAIEAARKRREIEDDVARLPDDELRRRLDKFVRHER